MIILLTQSKGTHPLTVAPRQTISVELRHNWRGLTTTTGASQGVDDEAQLVVLFLAALRLLGCS